MPPCATYYGSYNLVKNVNDWGDQHGLAGKVFSRIVMAPFIVPEAAGLAGDVVIDWIKGHTVNQESIADEGNVGDLNPLHDYLPARFKGPKTYLPGIRSDRSVDWEW